MTPLPHRYETELTGGPSGYARVAAVGLPALQVAQPADFDGPGDAWSPEHLLLAAVESCFLFTFRAVARASHADFASLGVRAAGTVDRQERTIRFTEIVLEVEVTVPDGTDQDRLRQVLAKTERACLVSASLSTPVRVVARVDLTGRARTPIETA